MIPMTMAEAAAAVGGRLSDADPHSVITTVVIDSRQATAGSLFIALPGAHVDGADFADHARARGAVAVLADRETGGATIIVDDAQAALGRLAAAVRARLSCTVIAITGSSGKTTTKDLLAQILEASGPTVAPVASHNNEIGCPMTILSADAETRHLVLEMGMRGEGHIAYLCSIARPTVGVIVNVGTAHLGVVGSREGIARAKGEIVADLPSEGTAVLFGDDPIVRDIATRTRARVVTFGTEPEREVRATDIRVDERAHPSFTLHLDGEAVPVTLQVVGQHQVQNALAAAAAAACAGLDIEQIAVGLRIATTRSRWRMEVHDTRGGITVVNDAYNANPESMRAALAALHTMAAGRRTWAVMGEMRELGDASATEHEAIGRHAADLGITHLVCVGSGVEPVVIGAGRIAVHVPDIDAALELLGRDLMAGDVVLVKASRSVGLERIAQALIEEVAT